VNDGLVSTFLLVAGVAGGGLLSRDILLTAIAGAVAGAVSMAAGEYVATKSQNQVLMVRTFLLCLLQNVLYRDEAIQL
jgi:VIT1/CCC1 family predicted Fe2+/Mn2+ transporter